MPIMPKSNIKHFNGKYMGTNVYVRVRAQANPIQSCTLRQNVM